MKSISVIIVILSIALTFFGCAEDNAHTSITSTTSAPVESLSEPLEDTMDMTIAQLRPSGIPIEPGHCFYAHDEGGNFYRVLWEQTETLVPEAKVQVNYHSQTKLEYPDGYVGGYTPQYEITAVAVTVLEIPEPLTDRSVADDFLARRCDVTDLSGFVINTATDERGRSFVEYGVPGGFYLVAVSAEGTAEYVFDGIEEYAHYPPLATPQAIRQADEISSAQAP